MNFSQNAYAAYHKSEDVLMSSSSGGAFTALSDYIISNNGIVVGGYYDYMTHNFRHILISTQEERNTLRGSKYMQSQVSRDVYIQIKKYLIENRLVLFVGTPCQVAAVIRYLDTIEVARDTFYGVDLLCHGVGSPGIWDAFVKFLQRKYKTKIRSISFKDKRKGWLHPTCIAQDEKKEYSLRGYSWFYFSNNIMRPACYNCRFSSLTRVGDITIGDYWKAGEKVPQAFSDKGTSLVITNTQKGQELFQNARDSMIYQKSTLEDCIQPNMLYSTPLGKYRREIMWDFQKGLSNSFFRKWKIIFLFSKVFSIMKNYLNGYILKK